MRGRTKEPKLTRHNPEGGIMKQLVQTGEQTTPTSRCLLGNDPSTGYDSAYFWRLSRLELEILGHDSQPTLSDAARDRRRGSRKWSGSERRHGPRTHGDSERSGALNERCGS
jgi:hypothetical protein